ncbi:HipA family kinase [Staphylococcus delphini]|uniref:HipA family kinase n=1 Tax=Staphylococcus delphini TaxID=53344 RepID=UPI000BBCC707|nr:HipA family kinase [Staphylococcus delphini]PCF78149.1 hypothetical protein B4W69_13700 [Staphylococcus delphini]
MEVLTEISDYMHKGVTEPVRCYIGDKRVIAKYVHNDEGFISLFNELLGYHLAIHFGVRSPKFGVAIFDQTITKNKVGKNYINKTLFTYTELIDKVLPISSPKMLNKIAEEEIINLLLFDIFIYNKDRNKGNIVVAMPLCLYPIDYTHILPGGCIWPDEIKNREYTIDDIIHDMFTNGYYQYLIENKVFENDLITECGKIFIKKFESLNEQEIIDKLPQALTNQLSEDNYFLLFEYFEYMKQNFEFAIEKLKRYIGKE